MANRRNSSPLASSSSTETSDWLGSRRHFFGLGEAHCNREIAKSFNEVKLPSALCSSEFREQQIKLDERQEKAKCSVASRKDSFQASTDTAASEASGIGEAVAAG